MILDHDRQIEAQCAAMKAARDAVRAGPHDLTDFQTIAKLRREPLPQASRSSLASGLPAVRSRKGYASGLVVPTFGRSSTTS
jgi:hypothetical protein